MHGLRIAVLLSTGLAFVLAGGVMAGTGKAPQGAKPPAKQDKPADKPPAQQADKPAAEKPPAEKLTVHGGTSKVETEHAFEVVFTKTGIKVYPYDMKGEPIVGDGLSGNAVFTLKKAGDKPQDVAFKVVPGKDGSRSYLAADTDTVAITTVKITVKGLKGEKEKQVIFDMPFTALSPEVHYVCPKCNGQMADPGECAKDKVKLEKKVATPKS